MVTKNDHYANEALEAEVEYKTAVEEAYDYVENFDILETITNVGNDEVFTPRKTADLMLDSLPKEVWNNPNYKWLNPATKNGIFEREIAIRLDKGLAEIMPDTMLRRKHILQNMIFSFGQTRFTSNVARRTVYYCSQANRKCDGIKASDGHYINGYSIGDGTWFDDEEGNIKSPCSNHSFFDSKGRPLPDNLSFNEIDELSDDSPLKAELDKYTCKYCAIKASSRYNLSNQREKYAYEFIHIDKINLVRHLQDRFFKGDRNMTFDIIIGNPPYQLDTVAGDTTNVSKQAKPIYNLFVDQARYLNPKYLCMIIQSRWFAGGLGLDIFRKTMMEDEHITKLVDYTNAKDCFPQNSIGGGVCFFLRERDVKGPCSFTNIIGGKKTTMIRSLSEFPVVVRYNSAVDMIRRILDQSKHLLKEIVSPISPFAIPTKTTGSEKKDHNNPITLYTSKGVGYINESDVVSNKNYLNKYKVMVSQLGAEHAGEPDKDGKFRVLTSSMRVLSPGEVCTNSYIVIGEFDSFEEANNLLDYLKTTFVRFLVLQAVSSIHISRTSFTFVPLVDFSKKWTDEKLYSTFRIHPDEINFINSMIKPIAAQEPIS